MNLCANIDFFNLLRHQYQNRWCIGIFCILLTSAVFSEDNSKKMKIEWDFGENSLIYSVDQHLQAQLEQRKENNEQWIGSPIRHEYIIGMIILNPLGDRNAQGTLALKLDGIETNGTIKKLNKLQHVTQIAAQFIICPDGQFETYSGGADEMTYLITRLIFSLPTVPLQENEVRIEPLKLFTRDEEIVLEYSGSIAHELKEFKIIDGVQCAELAIDADLSKIETKNKKISLKISGLSYYGITNKNLFKGSWQIAKKTETHEKNKPSARLIEITEIEISLTEKSNLHPDIQKLLKKENP